MGGPNVAQGGDTKLVSAPGFADTFADMSGSLLAQLKTMTVVVADTGDIHSIEQFVPRDATTNPSLLTAAADMPAYSDVVDEAVRWGAERGSNTDERLSLAMDRLGVAFGTRILNVIPGRVSTEVDARLSYDTEGTIKKAHELIAQYKDAGVENDRILIKIAATWEGIRAAEVLEKEGIHCNLTLLFGMHQAVACADANVTLISPFVGRILDWYKKKTGKESYAPVEDPGVVGVTRIFNYYKNLGHRTEVMGASFRNVGEIIELAGCDLLTISPALLKELDGMSGTLERKLNPPTRNRGVTRMSMTKSIFDAMHAGDEMASDKLSEGIAGFTAAIVQLETKLRARLLA